MKGFIAFLIAVYVFGWIVRYFMLLREGYDVNPKVSALYWPRDVVKFIRRRFNV